MKEETLEEAAERLFPDSSIQKRIFIWGAKWQQERMYSEEEVLDVLRAFYKTFDAIGNPPETNTIPLWFEQFKKK